ncbi:MAG: glycosyltransferase family 2 protein [Gemmatimonadaceae bacterium]
MSTRREGGRRLSGHVPEASGANPLVSIVTAVYNGAKHIEETILAIAGQTYMPVQHIVVDGGSTDGTVEILEKYGGTLAYWVSEPDNGIYDAMNKGIDLVADAESYILFANADDHLYSPEAVDRMIAASSGEDLLYGRMVLTDGDISGIAGRKVDLDDLAQETLCHPATFVRRKIFDRVGKFDTTYRIAADYDHIVRCFAAPVSTRFVDVIVSTMRMGGLSDDRFLLSCRERKAVIRKRFPLVPRLKGVWQVNLYDIPRNMARRWIDRAGLLGRWRALKGS